MQLNINNNNDCNQTMDESVIDNKFVKSDNINSNCNKSNHKTIKLEQIDDNINTCTQHAKIQQSLQSEKDNINVSQPTKKHHSIDVKNTYKCDKCDIAFSRNEHLNSHKIIHS